MNIHHLQLIGAKPELYKKGSLVMWTDPHISKQLLEMHINPNNDMASRSRAKIEYLTGWILKQCGKNSMSILDLGCGPGLYAEMMAEKGHAVTGVDFSENSIAYAVSQAKQKKLKIEYLCKNYLECDFENQFDLVIFIYLDFCVLLPHERDKVLTNIYKALKPGGLFIVDVVNEKNIDRKIMSKSWDIQKSGFWKDSPYMVLSNGYHYPDAKVMAEHHVVIDEKNKVETCIFWNHYFETQEIEGILESIGFSNVKNFENVLPESDCWNGGNVTFYVSQKI